ncbi:hypothetical protein DYB32_010095 [Aphanomyces invadans]|uniref:Protein kinase domain-containing protein n=1 Tax=Aphanomyces invadans TaxID=157072 RepID=A0A3R6VEB6_9STRA|nr:hypothetical protein DYB32_010095 [Aphanomyces invadans]
MVALLVGGLVLAVLLVVGYALSRRGFFSRFSSSERFSIETAKAPQLENFPTVAGTTLLHCGDMIDDVALERISLGDDLIQFRIPLPEIKILRPLVSKATQSPNNKVVVYTAKFNDAVVVLKTLTTDGTSISPEAEAFVQTIRLHSTLNHPKLVAFLGVVWSTNAKKNIVGYGLLMEHLSRGDLARLLALDAAKSPTDRILQWRPHRPHHRSKASVLLDIASAIVYLHSFSPAILHRNIESSTILLADNWDAKLSGISANATKPSLLITAPEVLKGDAWTEKADVYSFGILMCELDLGHHPYMSTSSSTSALSTRQLATLVMADLLQPTFSPDCPPEIQDIATKCLAFDSKLRPTAVQMDFWLRKYRRTEEPAV